VSTRIDQFMPIAPVVPVTSTPQTKKNKNRSTIVQEDTSSKLLVIEPLSQPEQWEKDPAYARYSQLKG